MKLAILATLAACGGSAPATHYYTLPMAAKSAAPGTGPTLAIDTLEAARPYDDERMVYRADAFRVDFYEYHRWAAPPGALVSDYLVEAFARSGRFRAVGREPNAQGAISIGGRVVALEEVDATPQRWLGHVTVSLVATDRATGRVLWTRELDDSEPMPTRSPDGLARAVGVALARIADRAIPQVAELDRAHASQTCASAP
ncbi:MAG TPA: ABC-type transport auxiliary lipoprotein family protein [Kofleriaceae bacterium]|jgi:uncharacterized lipoprotein YmbA